MTLIMLYICRFNHSGIKTSHFHRDMYVLCQILSDFYWSNNNMMDMNIYNWVSFGKPLLRGGLKQHYVTF